tara:strand:+ start:24 stop:188 length:165 start_codon:yes stop_codon:yes gene_type:complete
MKILLLSSIIIGLGFQLKKLVNKSKNLILPSTKISFYKYEAKKDLNLLKIPTIP